MAEGVEEIIKALVDSESQRKAIVDGFPGIMILFDLDLKAKWVSRAAESRYPDAIGKRCHEIFCFDSDKCPHCAFRRSLMSGAIESTTIRTGMADQDGEETIFDISASPVRSQGGEVTGTIVIAQNVTEQYRLEKQLRHTQKMEAIGTLAGGVAHDFNNILTPIMGYTEIIRLKMRQDNFRDQIVFDYLEEILKAAKRAKALVEQVLTFSRSIEKKAVLQYIHPIVKEVLKLMRVTLPSTIIIRQDIDVHCGRVIIDSVQLHQILINLCTNAADAMGGRHGTLTVSMSSQAGADGREWVLLCVTDTGCGIPRENLDRIYEPYFTTKEKTSGTGMGLAMVHGIIARQGGRIEVESEVGKGTAFRIYLPVVKRESSIEQIVSIGDLKSGSGNILLVDDEPQVVQVTGEILQSLGYKVTGKTSPREAFAAFKDDPKAFDLLLTDLTMPELTGLELAEGVKKMREDLPVILCTGYSDQIPEEEAVRAGISEYCMKPISMRELSQLVGKFLARRA